MAFHQVLLAARRPTAEVRYLALLACVRGSAESSAPLLLRLVEDSGAEKVHDSYGSHDAEKSDAEKGGAVKGGAEKGGAEALRQALRPNLRPSLSDRLVALEGLGTHGAHGAHVGARDGADEADAVRAVDAISAVLGASASEDGGARAVAARSLAQLTARALGACSARAAVAVGRAVGALTMALYADADRYVRAHASEALANVAVLTPVWAAHCTAAAEAAALEAASRAAAEALSASGLEKEVAEMLRRLKELKPTSGRSAALGEPSLRAGAAHGAAPAEAAVEAAHDVVRWLCSRRRCPITMPESPF